ncbi:hypothetical protein KA005_22360, partial [bacterium]|nr:hypothetical protein [bacterium]
AQTGTASPIIVPDTGRHDNVAVMAGAGEQVSVTPRGEATNGVNIKVEIDKQVIFDIANQGIESGDIRITTDNIQGGIAV